MCGISGVFRFDGNAVDEKTLRSMTGVITNRGPDDEGFLTDGPTGFGFRRLSILDLSPSGHQPMSDSENSTWIMFNGEAYNYVEIREELEKKGHEFRSTGDTEVLLRAYLEWGPKFIEKFNGMWALALWDSRINKLFLYRDRLGVKPVYFWQDREKIYFASEIKAILQNPEVPRIPNDQRIYDFLTGGLIDHTSETFFEGIKQLVPGTYMEISSSGLKTVKYWDLEDTKKNLKLDSDEQYAEIFRELFFDSVRLRLRSDVPVGTCLSGGLDSSAIAMVANKFIREDGMGHVGDRQKTFTSVAKEKQFDERSYAELIVKKTGARGYQVSPQGKDLFKLVDAAVWHQDEPFGSTSIFAQWHVFKLASEHGMKVMLDGQGADEMLGGYHPFFAIYYLDLLKKGRVLEFIKEFAFYIKNHGWNSYFIKASFKPRSLAKAILPKWLIGRIRGKVVNSDFLNSEFKEKFLGKTFDWRGRGDSFKAYMYNMIRVQSLPGLLHYEDRNSMTFSIEARVPFLDYRLVEFCYSLPENQIIRNGTTKFILRNAMKGILPEKVRTRQDKMGFVTPESVWFRGEARRDIAEIISSKSFKSRKYFNHQAVSDLFQNFLNSKDQSREASSVLWRIINLELWMRKFIDPVKL